MTEPTPLLEPVDGIPPVTDTPDGYVELVQRLSAGHGPIAVDAERASGYRYGQKAYLVQFRRRGSGTHLLDPIAFHDFSALATVLSQAEWVLHAASQDLPCLLELSLVPHSGVFDTELAARLLGKARVGLGPLVEETLGLSLAKEHSAVNWSLRPLPDPWLRYAALDVEVLLELRDVMEQELIANGKDDFARQEFAHVVASAMSAEPPRERWRRTSGLHKVRGRRALTVVKSMWEARDRIAALRDIHPTRILHDNAICEAASSGARSIDDLLKLPSWASRNSHRDINIWVSAISTAYELNDAELPVPNPPSDAPPAPRLWADRDPQAYARLSHARHALSVQAKDLAIPVENLITPDFVRRVAWQVPEDLDQRLAQLGARPWQRSIVVPLLRSSFSNAEQGIAVPSQDNVEDAEDLPQ